jgi:ComF family protein
MAAMRLADLGCYIQAASMLFYANEKHVQRLIFSFKYGGNKNLAFMMGKLMAEEARSCPEYMEADFLVPVPLHPRKEWRRGYNQVECLCRGISSVWGTPVAANALRRRRATRAQASKSRVERKNIMGKKTFVANNIEGLEGKKLLLVDDVLTTGSTLAACIDALLEIPDVSICVMTLSIA